MDFLFALKDIAFVRYALLMGLLASIATGVVGSYVVARRITYIAAAIAHCVLGGIGVAVYLQAAWNYSWCSPIFGGLAAALLAALIIGTATLRRQNREDTIISAVWVIGMSIGLLFFARTPAFVDPMSYLFGDILLISAGDLWLVSALDVLVVGLSVLLYPQLLAVCFDEEFAALRGLRVKLYYFLLLGLTALTVVLLVRMVGVVLVIALITLPAATAGRFARRLWQMMCLAAVFSMVYVGVGLAASYAGDLPSGATIVLAAGGGYLLSLACHPRK